MILKTLRQNNNYSQDQLAQMSGISLRTIQRIESGQKASMESLKSIAAVFQIDVAQLQQEIMVIDKNSVSWQKNPIWLRILFWGSNKVWMNKKSEAIIFEWLLVIGAMISLLLGFSYPEPEKAKVLLNMSYAFLLSAYLWAVLIRLSDKYSIWRSV